MQFAPRAIRYALGAGVLGILALFVTPWISLLFLGLAAFILWFFRDPERTPPPAGIVAPADGTITAIRDEDEQVRVCVFMNLHDIHVNRAPKAGTVTALTHTPGANRPAFTKESDRNERVQIDFDTYQVVLIAGWFARRITTYVDPEDTVTRGQRIGHIAFGSRADVLLPANIDREDLTVREGNAVRAGESVIARNPD